MTKEEALQGAQAVLRQKKTELGQAESAEMSAYESAQRQPSTQARVEWLRRLSVVNTLQLHVQAAEKFVADVAASPDDKAAEATEAAAAAAESPAAATVQ